MGNSRKWPYFRKAQSSVSKSIPSWYEELESELIDLTTKKKELEERLQEVRDELKSSMISNKLTHIGTKRSDVYYIKTFAGRKVDSKLLKSMHPEIYLECSTPYEGGDYITFTAKKNGK